MISILYPEVFVILDFVFIVFALYQKFKNEYDCK